mmetsp:Transcript_35383/g.54162  ORF Transcript_35383/g.54162 Transcript_35383/m.54162 type:complete len:99 (+) Transcript_35383:777-1073(+)
MPTRPKTQMKPRDSGVETIYRPRGPARPKQNNHAHNKSLDHQFKYLNHLVHLENDHQGTKRVKIEQPTSYPMPHHMGKTEYQKNYPKKSVTIKPTLQN